MSEAARKREAAGGSFLRHAAVYGLGTVLLQAAGYFLIPIYTRCLSTAEFGTLEILNRIAELTVIVLLFNAWRQTALAFHGRSDDPDEQRQVVVTLIWTLVGMASVGGAAAFVLAGPIASWQGIGDTGLLRLALLAGLLEALFGFLLVFLQARQESVLYVSIALAQFLARLGLILVLVVGCKLGIHGILLGSAIVSGGASLFLIIRELANNGHWPNLALLPGMLAFAVPFLPNGLCFFFLNFGDRFFLKIWGGDEAVGTYALGYKLAMAVNLLGRLPLSMVWSARMYQAARLPDAPTIFGLFFSRLLGVYLFFALGACLLQEEAICILGGTSYLAAASIVAPVILAYGFQAAADWMDAAFYVRRQTIHKTWITLLSAGVMLGLYALLIPRWTATGAAFATLAGFAFHALLTWIVSRRIFPVHYEWNRVGTMLVLAAAIWGVSRMLPLAGEQGEPLLPLWTVPIKLGLWLLWPILLWSGGWITLDEKERVAGLMRLGLAWFGIHCFGKPLRIAR